MPYPTGSQSKSSSDSAWQYPTKNERGTTMRSRLTCSIAPRTSRPSNLPLHILDTDLLPRLLIIVKPLPLRQINPREPRVRLEPRSQPIPLRLKLRELKPSAVEFNDVAPLGRRRVWVGRWRISDAGGVFAFAVFAAPDEVRFASAAALLMRFLQQIGLSAWETGTGRMGSAHTKRLMLTQFGWVSRQEVHWTRKL